MRLFPLRHSGASLLIVLLLSACSSLDGDPTPMGDDDAPLVDGDQDGHPVPEDCNDTNPTINPDAAERCNGIDDDCDGIVDEADAVDPVTWYADADGDGYGNGGETALACSAPAGFVSRSSDCDDADPLVSPDAPEACGDGIDNNCDGTGAGCGIEGDMTLADAAAAFHGIGEGSRAGWSVAGVGDVNGDGRGDLLIGSPYDDSGALRGGAAYLVYGGDALSGDIGLEAAPARFLGEASYDFAGYSVAAAGDINQDGLQDLLIGSPYHDHVGEDGSSFSGAGATYLIYGGPLSGDRPLSTADAIVVGTCAGCVAGQAVAGAGDVNGDGYDDILVGAWGYDREDDPETGTDEGAVDAGAAFLFYGPLSGSLGLEEADAVIIGDLEGGGLGASVAAAGDVNQDGFGDLLVGAPDYNGRGAAFLYYGPISDVRTAQDADARLMGDEEGAQAGYAVSSAGDLNDDGRDDVIVTAPYDPGGTLEAGAVFVFFGPVVGEIALDRANLTLQGEGVSDHAGYSVSPGGDLNGDGVADLVIGSQGDSKAIGVPARNVYAVFGPASGVMSLSNADVILTSDDASLSLGHAVSLAQDVNGDGQVDLLCGVPDRNDDSSFPGAAYLLLGAEGI